MLARAVRALMAERREWEGTASELLDLFGPAVPDPEREGVVGRTEPARANAAHRRGRRASPPDQRPARNHDRPAAVTHVTHSSRVVRHVRH